MSQRLPLQPSIPHYRVGTVLDGIPYIIDMNWNSREEAWYMDLLEEDETPIRNGMKLVLGARIGRQSAELAFPNGSLIVSDLEGSNREPALDDMGERTAVYFFTADEIEDL